MNTVYPMRKWYFEDALGRYDLDLGDSFVGCGSISDLAVPEHLSLDYGNSRGSDRLRRAVATLYGRDEAGVGVTHGSQEALYLLYTSLLAPGDHVVAFAPGWQQSVDVPTRLGCSVDVVGTLATGHPDVEAALEAIRAATKVVVLNSPCNPTGKRIRDEDVERLVEAARAHGAYLVLDEEYVADLAAESLVGRYERAVSVCSVSKVYGYPGLRTGWMCGAPEIVDEAMRQRHYTTLSGSVLLEELAAQVLENRDHYHHRYRRLIDDGYSVLRDWVDRHGDVLRMAEPEGTPFAWVEFVDGRSSLEFCRRLLDQAQVLLMPAEVFGARSGLRVTFARDAATLRSGLERIEPVLSQRPATVDGDGTDGRTGPR